MDAMTRIERALGGLLATTQGGPPRLAAAMHHAVFPRGARVRPRLCLAVAAACGDDQPALAEAAAIALEVLHCASLVHDDLPCFDDAATRRGKPSVHAAYGEPLAVLAGDALIVLAFQAIGRAGHLAPQRLAGLIGIVGDAVGAPRGICAGQAWECEPACDLSEYHRQKTGALFAAASMAGAVAAGANGAPWSRLGECLGEAYQVADDLRDALEDASVMGKPAGRDAALGRPSVVAALGVGGAVARLGALAAEAVGSIPACRGRGALEALILGEAKRLRPQRLDAVAA